MSDAPAPRKIWFPAKTHGWGWGPPVCWQGWVVLVVWFLLLLAGTLFLPHYIGRFIIWALFWNGLLFYICWRKGEKPRWRWGKK